MSHTDHTIFTDVEHLVVVGSIHCQDFSIDADGTFSGSLITSIQQDNKNVIVSMVEGEEPIEASSYQLSTACQIRRFSLQNCILDIPAEFLSDEYLSVEARGRSKVRLPECQAEHITLTSTDSSTVMCAEGTKCTSVHVCAADYCHVDIRHLQVDHCSVTAFYNAYVRGPHCLKTCMCSTVGQSQIYVQTGLDSINTVCAGKQSSCQIILETEDDTKKFPWLNHEEPTW